MSLAIVLPETEASAAQPPAGGTVGTSTDDFHADEPNVRQVLEWYEKNAPNSNCKKSQKERARLYAMFAAEHGERRVSECKPFELLDFINRRAKHFKDGKEQASDWTRKRWASTLQRPFNFAVQLGLIDRNPYRGLRFPEGKGGRDWTKGEYQAMLRHAKPHVRRFLVFIRFSGMRPGEIRDMERRNVRGDAKMIVIESHKMGYKTRMPRRVPMNSVMEKLLAWLTRNNPPNSRRLFLNAFYRPWKEKTLNDAIGAVRERASLPPDVKLHGGRHTFGTNAILNGLGLATLAEILGHDSLRTTERYVHLAGKTDHLNAAMEQAVKSKNGGTP